MLDTVRLGVKCSLGLGDLGDRGWTVRTRSRGEKFDASADIVTPEGVRLGYGAGFGWLSAEVSLPGLLLGDNARLVDWRQCRAGFERVQASAGEAVGRTLPEIAEWRASRLDPVWAWDVDPALYLAALRWSRLPRTEVRWYDGSVSWVTRSGRVRGRGYDKAREAGHEVGLPFRLERQVRPSREVVRVGARRLPTCVGGLKADHVLGVLSETLDRLGLSSPVPGPFEARRLLLEVHGARRGRNLFRVLREVQDFGGAWPGDIPPTTRRRYERQLRRAGIRSLSWEGALPALAVPRSAFLPQ